MEIADLFSVSGMVDEEDVLALSVPWFSPLSFPEVTFLPAAAASCRQ